MSTSPIMMREIKYVAHEFHHDPMKRRAPLPYFLLDIPYLFITGTIPPLSILMKKYARFVPRELREDTELYHHHDYLT